MKRFLASLIGVVVFFLLVPTCTIFIVRGILSENTVEVMVDTVPNILEVENEDGTTENIIESFISDVEKEDPALAKYFKEEEIKEELVILLTTAIENLANPDAEYLLDTTSLKEYIENIVKSYEKEKGVNLGSESLDEIYEAFDEELMYPREEAKEELGGLLTVLEVVFSNKLLITLISLIALCIVLIFVLVQSIPISLLKIKTPFLVNGIITLIIGAILNSILKSVEMNEGTLPSAFVGAITAPFFKVAFISIIIAIGLIVAAKVLKHNKSIENSNDAIENLGNANYTPNNVSNTPYTGDTNI